MFGYPSWVYCAHWGHVPRRYGTAGSGTGEVLWGILHCGRCGATLEPVDPITGRPLRQSGVTPLAAEPEEWRPW